MAERLKIILSPEEITQRIKELGEKISREYEDKPLVLIGILKGAFVFLADLMRALRIPHVEVDFVRLQSYGLWDTSTGEVRITKDVELPLQGKHVLIIEDIVDTGYTLAFLRDHLLRYKPASVKTCCFIDKAERRQIPVEIHYRAFEIPKGFLVGYGLDFAEKYRYLPGVYEIVKE